MAGLLLYRIAEGQFFLDGNKRTAVVAATIFLRNHGLASVHETAVY
jgi:prophage maintenance system killer protein